MKHNGTHILRDAALCGCVVVLLASSVSCQITKDAGEGSPATITFSTDAGTKVPGENPSGETAIGSLVATAFRPDGVLDGQSQGTASSVTVECTTGERDFIVAANVDVSSARSRQEMEQISIAIEDIVPSGLPMSESLHRKVESVNPTVRAVLERHVSKSWIGNIILNMTSEHLASQPFRLDAVYNTNVAADTRLDGAFLTGRYINRLGWQGESSSMTRDDIGLDMTKGQKHDTPHNLYMLPNPQEDDSFDKTAWSPRHTRTVVEATLGGTTYYYPVTLPVTGRNVSYRFENILISRAGSLHPEDPLSYLSIVFSEPSVGDFEQEDGGALPFENKSCAIAFAPDGVDPFKIFEENIDLGSRHGVIYLGDGTLSPFNDITETLTTDSIRGIIIFKDGSVMPFDTFPENIDMGNVSKVIVFDDPDLEQYLKDSFALVIESAGGLVVFKDGSLLPFDTFPEGLDLGTVSRLLFFTEGTLEDFLKERFDIVTTSATGVLVYADGTVIPFDGMPSDVSLTGVKSVIFFDEAELQSFLASTTDIPATYTPGVIVLRDGTLLTFDQAGSNIDLTNVAMLISMDGMSLLDFITGTVGIELGVATGIVTMADGTVVTFDGVPSDVDMSGATGILTCNPGALSSFMTGQERVTVVSSSGLVVLGAGALEAYRQTVDGLVLGGSDPVFVFGDGASLSSFKNLYGDILTGWDMPVFVFGDGHSLKGWDMKSDTSLILR